MKKFRSLFVIVITCILFTTSVGAAVIPAWTNINGIFYNDKGEEIKGAIAKGIDVSYHQGNIDWAKVKQSGIEFAIIRCGYGDDDISQDDIYFEQNIRGCEQNGIAYGIYIYSYATNADGETESAKSEASHILRLIRETNANPTMPIYYDIENNKAQGSMSATQLGDIAETFCNEIISEGYKVGVYSNYEWWTKKLTDERFNRWDKWVARYNSSCDYANQYNIWQFTEKGTVDGIAESADINILLSKECSVIGHTYELEQIINQATTGQSGAVQYKCKVCGHKKTETVKTIGSVAIDKTSYIYSGKANKPAVIVKDSDGINISADNYIVAYNKNTKPGQATVKITFQGKYTGNVTKTFIIKPEKVKLQKVTNQKGKKVKVTWKKAAGASGLEVMYAKKKNFKKGKKTVNVKASAKTKTITKLNAKNTYYFRVRAYKKINGKKVYGLWSNTKKVKVTK